MNNEIGHLSSDHLHAYVDGRLSGQEHMDVEMHLGLCESCMRGLRTMLRVEASMRSLPLERLRPGFTTSVMNTLGVARRSPLMFRALEKSAYVFGLSIVLGIMLAAFLIAGIIDQGAVVQSRTFVDELTAKTMAGMAATITTISGWLSGHLMSMFGKGSMSIAISAVGVAALLAVADRLVERRVFRRTR